LLAALMKRIGGMRRAFDGWAVLLIPTVLVMAVVFGIPLADLVLTSFREMTGPAQVGDGFSFASYRAFFSDLFLAGVLANTLKLGAIVVALCILIAYPTSYYLARMRSRWRGVLQCLVLAPLLTSAVVRNLGWFPILSESGLINWVLVGTGLIGTPIKLLSTFSGVVIGLVNALLPFMILVLMTVIQKIDRDLEEAAANLGSGRFETFWRVILPLSLPGVVSGSLLVFTMTISSYTTPAILGGNRVPVMATYTAQQFRIVLDYPMGATAAVLLMVVVGFVAILALRVKAREGGQP
jgi:putative spermidine/putrescine transport system permease protein